MCKMLQKHQSTEVEVYDSRNSDWKGSFTDRVCITCMFCLANVDPPLAPGKPESSSLPLLICRRILVGTIQTPSGPLPQWCQQHPRALLAVLESLLALTCVCRESIA